MLSQDVNRFVELHRSIGFKFRTQTALLHNFGSLVINVPVGNGFTWRFSGRADVMRAMAPPLGRAETWGNSRGHRASVRDFQER